MHAILDQAFALLGKDIVIAHAKDLLRDGEAGNVAADDGKIFAVSCSLKARSGVDDARGTEGTCAAFEGVGGGPDATGIARLGCRFQRVKAAGIIIQEQCDDIGNEFVIVSE